MTLKLIPPPTPQDPRITAVLEMPVGSGFIISSRSKGAIFVMGFRSAESEWVLTEPLSANRFPFRPGPAEIEIWVKANVVDRQSRNLHIIDLAQGDKA